MHKNECCIKFTLKLLYRIGSWCQVYLLIRLPGPWIISIILELPPRRRGGRKRNLSRHGEWHRSKGLANELGDLGLNSGWKVSHLRTHALKLDNLIGPLDINVHLNWYSNVCQLLPVTIQTEKRHGWVSNPEPSDFGPLIVSHFLNYESLLRFPFVSSPMCEQSLKFVL